MSGRTVDTAGPGVVAVVLLRHAGSALTRAALRSLDAAWDDLDMRGVRLIAVIEGSARAAADVVPRLHVRFPVVHDPDGVIHDQYGAGRDPGLVRTALDPRTPARWFGAWLQAGHGAPGGPLDRRMAAAVARDGVVTWAWEGATAAEPVPVNALRDATGAEGRGATARR